MSNKKMIIAVSAVVAVIGIMLGAYFATRPETTQGNKTFTVTVMVLAPSTVSGRVAM